MRVLVTGAAGFIGSHFVRQGLSGSYPEPADAHVLALDKPPHAGKIAEELGWAPRVAFETGLAKTLDWSRANGTWWKALKP
ncbi:hypothetical protein [Streptomyces sp. NPDC013187]|uniref:hypothetical protein n=1 Tax=Streptomyces sp. NPDC013187 TaxID=3364865 RepID=UPI003681C772